jgi:hypothetical protein
VGAFLLVSQKEGKFDSTKALETIRYQCRTDPVSFRLNGWDLYLFPKLCIGARNYREAGTFSLFASGTPFLPGHGYSSSLDILTNQLVGERFAGDTLKGLFFILLNNGKELQFLTDKYGLYSIFHSSDGNIISSSFLSICSGLSGLTLNREAITENLLTGSIIGKDTIFNEVKRFEPAFPFRFEGLKFIRSHALGYSTVKYKNRKESLTEQIEALDRYFTGLKPLAEEQGSDSGITGGLDSRLLFALCRRHFDKNKLQFHAHLRKTPDRDYLIGREICNLSDLTFIENPVTDISDIPGVNIPKVLDNGMLFNDGQIRTHSFWHEQFNTTGYRVKILTDKGLGLNGIGGEQYRNMERFMLSSWDFRNWITFELIEKYAGKKTAHEKTRLNLTESLLNKIIERLGADKISSISLLDVKRYMNEIFNPANRALRGSFENKISFFLSPFTDPQVAETAYNSVEFLGATINYEAELINMIDPEVASVRSVYGFSFNKGERMSSYLPDILFRNLFPGKTKSFIFERVSSRDTDRWDVIRSAKNHLKKCIDVLASYQLPVDTSELVLRTDLGPLAFAMGHLLERYSEKIKS